ncbi:MAG: TrmH family RNA methyltransferase, partial [Thermoplasmatota archaeon]
LEALRARLAPDIALSAEVVARDELAAVVPRAHVLAVARRPEQADPLASDGRVVLLEDPRHLGNLGACVRVAAAAGVAGVITTGRQDPWHPDALRGSAGLHFALPVRRVRAIPEGRALLAPQRVRDVDQRRGVLDEERCRLDLVVVRRCLAERSDEDADGDGVKNAKDNCPISVAIKGNVELSVDAKLEAA